MRCNVCVSPNYGIIDPISGRANFSYKNRQTTQTMGFPCGKCHECISKRASDFALRAEHELSQNEFNAFVTFTYAEDKLLSDLIVYRDFQIFIKSLRYKYSGTSIRYMVSCEYGEQLKRPHFHAILFNYYPSSNNNHTLLPIRRSPSGHMLYESSELRELWNHGFHSVSPATVQTAYYIASYALSSLKHEVVVKDGEIFDIMDTMKCSTNPAIGLSFFRVNYKSVIGKAIFSGGTVPRYYEKKMKQWTFPMDISDLKHIPDDWDNNLYYLYVNHKESLIRDISEKERLASLLEYKSKKSIDDVGFRKNKDFTHLLNHLRTLVQ